MPEDLVFNADETSAEVGMPIKVLVLQSSKRGFFENEFKKNIHITAMVAINAAGNEITPYLILPLKYLPRNITHLIARSKLNVGGSSNDEMTEENCEEWSIWFIQYVINLKKQRNCKYDQRAILFLDG